MAMDGCGNLMKYCFGFINLIIFVGGGALLGVGIAALVSDDSDVTRLIDTDLYQGTAIVLIITGSLILLVSFLGCCGAFKESKCLLGMFFCLILVLFILTAAGVIAGFLLGAGTILDNLGTDLKKSMNNYNSEKPIKESWDWIQQNFECCGVDGPSDWAAHHVTPKPASCFTDNDIHKKPFTKGCLKEVKDLISDNSKLFGGISIGVLIFLFLSMIFSCAIRKSIH